jgi:hypothetical protein
MGSSAVLQEDSRTNRNKPEAPPLALMTTTNLSEKPVENNQVDHQLDSRRGTRGPDMSTSQIERANKKSLKSFGPARYRVFKRKCYADLQLWEPLTAPYSCNRKFDLLVISAGKLVRNSKMMRYADLPMSF